MDFKIIIADDSPPPPPQQPAPPPATGAAGASAVPGGQQAAPLPLVPSGQEPTSNTPAVPVVPILPPAPAVDPASGLLAGLAALTDRPREEEEPVGQDRADADLFPPLAVPDVRPMPAEARSAEPVTPLSLARFAAPAAALAAAPAPFPAIEPVPAAAPAADLIAPPPFPAVEPIAPAAPVPPAPAAAAAGISSPAPAPVEPVGHFFGTAEATPGEPFIPAPSSALPGEPPVAPSPLATPEPVGLHVEIDPAALADDLARALTPPLDRLAEAARAMGQPLPEAVAPPPLLPEVAPSREVAEVRAPAPEPLPVSQPVPPEAGMVPAPEQSGRPELPTPPPLAEAVPTPRVEPIETPRPDVPPTPFFGAADVPPPVATTRPDVPPTRFFEPAETRLEPPVATTRPDVPPTRLFGVGDTRLDPPGPLTSSTLSETAGGPVPVEIVAPLPVPVVFAGNAPGDLPSVLPAGMPPNVEAIPDVLPADEGGGGGDLKALFENLASGFEHYRRAVEFAGHQTADLADDSYLRAFRDDVELAAEGLREIPGAGTMAAAALEGVVQPIFSFGEVVSSFVDRGRQLMMFSGEITEARAMSDVRSMLGDLREAQVIGPGLSRLTEAQSLFTDEMRQLLLPIKDVVVKVLANAMEILVDAVQGIRASVSVIQEFAQQINNMLFLFVQGDFSTLMDKIKKLPSDIAAWIKKAMDGDKVSSAKLLEGLYSIHAPQGNEVRPPVANAPLGVPLLGGI